MSEEEGIRLSRPWFQSFQAYPLPLLGKEEQRLLVAVFWYYEARRLMRASMFIGSYGDNTSRTWLFCWKRMRLMRRLKSLEGC